MGRGWVFRTSKRPRGRKSEGPWIDLISGFLKKKPDKIRKPDKGIHIQTAIRF